MRLASFQDCLQVLRQHGLDPSVGSAIDVGGTREVFLKTEAGMKVSPNPILGVNPGVMFLDQGFNAQTLGTQADEQIDFLKAEAIQHLRDRFDYVFCFDVLEHVSNPFRFCDHLIAITKPGGHIYLATVFSYVYHPSPEDYFRFSPAGLRECFTNPITSLGNRITVSWCDWESREEGVAILVHKGIALERILNPPFRLARHQPSVRELLRQELRRSAGTARYLFRQVLAKP